MEAGKLAWAEGDLGGKPGAWLEHAGDRASGGRALRCNMHDKSVLLPFAPSSATNSWPRASLPFSMAAHTGGLGDQGEERTWSNSVL